jgi:5'-nucleotidase
MTNNRKPRILLSNDDGIDAPGIQALYRELKSHYDVLVVAPMYEKSGVGCAITITGQMEVDERRDGGKLWGYAVNGTPADCVKFALNILLDERPDLVLSGINRGTNLGNSVFYSGTVAAAIEATLNGLPAMACSLGCWGYPVAHYEDAARVVRQLVPWLLSFRHEPRTLWNINFPNRPYDQLGPIRLTSQGTSDYEDVFELERQDGPQRYYRNTGAELRACAVKDDSDDKAWAEGHIALSILRTDLSVPVPNATARALEQQCNSLLAGIGNSTSAGAAAG